MKTVIAGAESNALKSDATPADPIATADTESRTGSSSPVVRFGKPFDYTWPSRAMTSFPAGYQGRVKVEVRDAADTAGVLVDPLDE